MQENIEDEDCGKIFWHFGRFPNPTIITLECGTISGQLPTARAIGWPTPVSPIHRESQGVRCLNYRLFANHIHPHMHSSTSIRGVFAVSFSLPLRLITVNPLTGIGCSAHSQHSILLHCVGFWVVKTRHVGSSREESPIPVHCHAFV